MGPGSAGKKTRGREDDHGKTRSFSVVLSRVTVAVVVRPTGADMGGTVMGSASVAESCSSYTNSPISSLKNNTEPFSVAAARGAYIIW